MALQTVTLGDAITLSVPMRTGGAAFTPAAGYQLIFTAKLATSDADVAALIQKKSGGFGITESGSSALIELLPIDTSALSGDITLYCDIQAQSLTDASVIKTVALFQLLTVRDVTRDTDTSIPVYTSEPPGIAYIKAEAQSGSFTAVANFQYTLLATGTVTDPATAEEGDAFTVFVSAGTGTIGGTAYPAEAIIIRSYESAAWKNTAVGNGDALVADPLSQFAATTSAQLAGVLTDETGTGSAVFATSPTLKSPVIDHTATEADDHALEIDCDAAGFGDVKAIDVAYDTGAITPWQDEAVMLVNINQSAAIGGDVTALEVLATEGSANINGMLAGAGVNPIEQLSGVFYDMDSALVNATDRLTEFTTAGNDVQMFVADNDTVTIASFAKFEQLQFILAITASLSIRPSFEFSTGPGTWTAFTPVDGTNGMRNTGVIAWLGGDIPTWAVGTGGKYLIRITRKRNSLATPPTESKVQIAATTEYKWDKDGDLIVNTVTATGNVDSANTGANAPVSTAQRTAIDLKADADSDSTISAQRGATDVLSADNLRTAYTAAKALRPGGNDLAADNRAVVMVPAGRYDFVLGDVADSNHGLELDAEFVDLVGMTGVPEDVVLTSAIAIASRGTVEQTADDVKISGLTMEITSASSTGSNATEAAAYFPDTALANAVLSDVICQSENSGVYAMRTWIEYAGTYTRVTSGDYSFGYVGTASGTFTDCVGGTDSFGVGVTASGTFIRCVAGYGSFGSGGGTASGTFTDCVGGGSSFGGYSTSSGTFTDCVGGDFSFGGAGTASGTFLRCVAGSWGFGAGGTVDAGAVFIRCHGAYTGMNTGTTRLCYDASNNLIDNSGEFITSVTDNDAKLALTGIADGQQVEITDEGKRLERYTGDGARSATQDFTTVEVTVAGTDTAGDPYAVLYHWDASVDRFLGPDGQYIKHNATRWQHFDVGDATNIDAAAGAASVHPADADWSSTIFDGEIFARPEATERNWHTLKNTVYLTVKDTGGNGPYEFNGVTVGWGATVGIGWVPVGELMIVDVAEMWRVDRINGDFSTQVVAYAPPHCLTMGTDVVLTDSLPSGALVLIRND